ncbi:MAG: lysophospholipase [Candidatus Saganbacteria bacterium]|nr:lysophospholipase [Candidatus Saganbacteria bacterium]
MSELIRVEGTDILHRRWLANQPKACLLLVHGMGAHSNRWQFWADHFLNQGLSSYAIELKGFGRTLNRPRGHIDSFKSYYNDVIALRDQIAREVPGKKIFLVGESMGGLIAFMTAALHPEAFSGQVIMSPGFANAMKFKLLDYLSLPFFLIFDRRHLIQMPFTSAMCTRDEAYQKIMDNNPDEHRLASVKLLFDILLEQSSANSLAKDVKIPTLFTIAGQDKLVSPAAAKKLFEKIGSSDKKLIEYPEMFHALYIDKGREKVFSDIWNWLEGRI